MHVCEFLLRDLQLGLQIDQVLLQLRAQAHLFRELAVGSRKGSRSPTGLGAPWWCASDPNLRSRSSSDPNFEDKIPT
jgi:hypothetical protein